MRTTARNTILLYGVAMALLLILLKIIEYRFIVQDLSLEIALLIVAVMFATLGVWAGLRITRRRSIPSTPEFQVNTRELERLGISRRELEVLELMSRGLSNREIADALFISVSTVKTHTSNLLQKLGVGRRTQALRKGRELGLLP